MEDIRKLIDTYDQLVEDNRHIIGMTTTEQHHFDGYNAALKRVIYDLKSILYRSDKELTLKEKLAYTE